MAAPVWFDPKVYFNNKLASLEGYNDLTLTAAFTGAGYGVDADGLYRHFQDFGNAENVSPSAYFDAGYYMQAKAATYFGKAVNTVTGAEVSFVQEAFRQAGLSAWDHYLRYGMAEGVDPSASFDTSAYMDAKLAQMQKTDPSYTMDMLVQAFRDAGLNPVMHYLSYGRGEGLTIQDAQHGAVTRALTTGIDNLVGTTGTPTVDAAGNLVVNSNYDDYFTAETGTLQSADVIDGLGGVDTLYARLNTSEAPETGEALEPTIKNVEYVLFQAQVSAGPAGGGVVPVTAYIDADRIWLADGEVLTLGSVNSRAALSIEDVRHNSHETAIRFADADPGVDFDVFFDPQHLTSAASNTAGTLNIEIVDVRGAQVSNQPLENNPFDKFTFQYTDNAGATKLIELEVGAVKGNAGYTDLVNAFNTALKAAGVDSFITASLGSNFSASATVGTTTYTTDMGKYVVLTSSSGTIATNNPDGTPIPGTGWGVTSGTVPATGGIVWGAGSVATTSCPLISTVVELDNVGRVQWDDASPDCLPNDIIYGSRAGDLEIGSMSLRGGVERFDVKVDKGSWLSSLFSTNEALRMVTVEARDIDGDGKSGGQLYIGDWAGRGDQLGDDTQLTWTDAAKLLSATGAGTADPSGLNDVAVFDASDYAGAINIAAEITAASYDKYLKSVDGAKYIDKMYAPHAGYQGQFAYITGQADDVVNMTVNGAIAADVDFRMNIDTGAGNDLVAFRYAAMSANQENNQKNLQNVTIKTGEGDDTVWFYAPAAAVAAGGSVIINTGAGNDVIYANQQELFTGGWESGTSIAPADYNAVFVFNTNNRELVTAGLAGATLSNDLAVGQDTFAVNPVAGESLYVTVTFKGHQARAKIADVTAATTSVTAEQINHAIIDAIANDPVLKHLVSAKDGAGHTLLIESIINGQMTAADLGISFGALKSDGTTGASTVSTGTWYNTQFATNTGGTQQYTGNNSTSSQVIVDAGAGDDLVVLGPNAGRMDIIELRGNFGNDTVVGFRSGEDMINLAGYLDSTKPLNAGVPSGLVNNSAIVATFAGPKDTKSGIYTQAEVDDLVKDGNLSLTGANGDKAVAFLQAVNSEGQNVYTIVQMSTDGTTDKGTVMGSMTLDSVNGVKTSIASTDFRLDSVIRDSVTGKAYGPADYTGTSLEGTFFADTFNDVNSATLGTVTAIDGKEGDDTFNITGDLGAANSLEGGEGNDTFNVKSAAPINGGTIDGGAGFDTLTVDKMLTGDATLTALNNVENATFNNTGTVTITNMATADNASTLTAANTVTSLTINTLKADVATTIDGSQITGNVTVVASNSKAAVTLKGGNGTASLTGGDGNDTIITTGAGTSTITGGKGDDTIQLGSTGKDTVKFAANLADNGHDTITGFEAGAGKDVLDGTAFYTTKVGLAAAVDGSANDLDIGNAGTNNIGVLYNVAGGVLTADKVVTSGTAANGEVIIDAGKKAVVMVTADSAGAAATYNMYYVTGDATAPTVELVGTVTTDAAFDAGNFA